MKFEGMKEYQFYVEVGYVTLIAAFLTLVFTQIMKVILKKKNILYEGMEASKKDMILARIGRVLAFVFYTGLYFGNAWYFHRTIVFDETLITGLFAGAAFTLTITKGMYTTLHQWSKKKDIYDRLAFAEQIIEEQKQEQNEFLKETKANQKWILTRKQEKGKKK